MADNIVLGRGKLYFDRFSASTDTKGIGERYLGNSPEFALTVNTEKLEHYSAESGLKVKDISVTLQYDFTGSITVDNIDLDNMALFFFGEKAITAESAATDATDSFTVQQGYFYQLGVSASNPVGLRSTTVSSVTSNGGVTTHTLNTDYVVDDVLGRIYIVPGGGISDDTEIEVTYDVAAHTHDLVVSGTETIYGGLRFLAYNGVGKQTDFYMPKVSLSPTGDFALKGDDWQQMQFEIEVLQNGAMNHIYADGRPYTPS